MNYKVLSFYCYVTIDNPEIEVKKHRLFLEDLDVRARIYIAKNGINAQMSFFEKDLTTYLHWLEKDDRFKGAMFKVDLYHEHVYPRLTIKKRDQLVALDLMPDLKNRGRLLSPVEWKEMLEKEDVNKLLIDVRNNYESKIGYFEGAEKPDLKSFRQFPKYVEKLKKRVNPKKTKIMMYCTGGIRCETFSALLKEKGFNEVYQLEGGVINYGKKVGNKYWKGNLFVFDDRLSVPISDDQHQIVSHCRFCENKTDFYFNCANMDCNALFLSCSECSEKYQGCCSEKCEKEPRRRPYVKRKRPKPFRRWHHCLNIKK